MSKYSPEFNKLDKSTNLMNSSTLSEKLVHVIPVNKLSSKILNWATHSRSGQFHNPSVEYL